MASSTFELIKQSNRGAFLEELLDAYVDRQGLGAMPKGDLDALIVHLYRKYSRRDGFDAFELSHQFKIREGRLKSLVQVGELKFGTMVEGDAWCEVLHGTATARFALDSLERRQIRFKLENPALFPYLQKRLRQLDSTARYVASTEEVTIELYIFLKVLNQIHAASESDFSTKDHLDRVQKNVERTIRQIGKSLGSKRRDQLLKEDKSALRDALNAAGEFSSIGSLINAVFFATAT
jgi:hypothetical protein